MYYILFRGLINVISGSIRLTADDASHLLLAIRCSAASGIMIAMNMKWTRRDFPQRGQTSAGFEPEAPSVLEASIRRCPLAREVLYQAELRAHEYETLSNACALPSDPNQRGSEPEFRSAVLLLFPNHVPKEGCERKKEVIQPQVPLRLPCDDLAHLAELRFATANFAGAHLNPARVA